MKRLTLNLDLEDNQAFDKEVEHIIKAKVKSITNDNLEGFIEEAAKRALDRTFENKQYSYTSRIGEMAVARVREVIESRVNYKVADYHIDDVVKNRVKQYMDANEDRITAIIEDKFEDKCNEVIEKVINKKVEEKIKSLLS